MVKLASLRGTSHERVRGQYPEADFGDFPGYREWVQAYDTLGEKDRRDIQDAVEKLPRRPLFSIVLLPAIGNSIPAVEPPTTPLHGQIYPQWELWLPLSHNLSNLELARKVRIAPRPSGQILDPASLFNAALLRAEGEFVLPLPADVRLAESALYELAEVICSDPHTAVAYSDEDYADADGKRYKPRFKTAWDPDLALSRDSIGLFVAYQKALLFQLGGMRAGIGDIALGLYELSLRVAFTAPAPHIHHIPAVLCHRHGNAEQSVHTDADRSRKILSERLAELEPGAQVLPAPLAPCWNRIIRSIPDPAPLVSVIVPTRDQAILLKRCVDGLLSRTDYPNLELIIVDNDSREVSAVELLRHLSQDPRVRVLHSPGPFNYSTLNNKAANSARGEVIVLLNNDTEPVGSDWLRELVSHAVRPDVGAVGAKLLYPDGRVQHGGMVLAPGIWPIHQLRFAHCTDAGPFGELALLRSVSIVTGACLAMRRAAFMEVGGLDEHLSVAFSDVDLCLRLGDHGFRVVWTPFAELFHIESASRGPDQTTVKQAISMREASYFWRFWSAWNASDPFHNPNLSYGLDTITLASPPRRRRPWTTADIAKDLPRRWAFVGGPEAGGTFDAARAADAAVRATMVRRIDAARREVYFANFSMEQACEERDEARLQRDQAIEEGRQANSAAALAADQAAQARAERDQARRERDHAIEETRQANAAAVLAADQTEQVWAERNQAQVERHHATEIARAVMSSTSWRITRPLRLAGERAPRGLRRVLRRLPLLDQGHSE